MSGSSHGQTQQRYQLEEPARIAQGTYYDSEHSVPAVHELHALQAAVQKAATTASQRKAAASARSAALSAKTAANSTSTTSAAGSSASTSGRRLDKQNSSKNAGSSNTTGSSGTAGSSSVNGHGLSGSSSSSRLLQADARGPNTPLSQSLGVSAHSNEGRGTKRSRSDSESSLSPASSSVSSIDFQAPKPTSRAASPAGNNAAKAHTTASTVNGKLAPAQPKDSKGKAAENGSAVPTGLPAIPGLSAPVPALPGFKRKVKDAPAAGTGSASSTPRASPAPSAQSKPPEQRHPTSTLPPPPPSLPAKPLPAKPGGHALQRASSQQGSRESSSRPSASSSTGRDRKDGGSNLRQSDVDSDSSGKPSRDSSKASAAQPSSSKQTSKPPPPAPPLETPPPLPPPPPSEPPAPPASQPQPPLVAITSPTESTSQKPPNGADQQEPDAASSKPIPPISPQPIARKTLPPSAASVLASTTSASASASSTASTKPGTPQARKTLPASIAARASAPNHHLPSPSPSPSGRKDSPAPSQTSTSAGATTPVRYPGKPPPTPNVTVNGVSAPETAEDAEAMSAEAKEAKQKRKEEKKKRKLAAAGLGGAAGADRTPNGSPISKTPGSAGRNDSLPPPPNKIRKLEASPSQDSISGSSFKVKLNGFTLNRQKSATPSDSQSSFTQPAPPRKTVAIPGIADDFSLPSRSLVPSAPPLNVPVATAMKQDDVDEDFDHAKPASQVPYSTFANWANDYLRLYGEDDLAFLAPRGNEDPGIFNVPDLGPHYLDAWAAMDADLNGDAVDLPGPSKALIPHPPRRFKAEALSNETLTTENVYLGPLSERLISLFRHTDNLPTLLQEVAEQQRKDLDAAQNQQQAGDSGVEPAQISPALPTPALFGDQDFASQTVSEQDAADFETRLMRELAFLGVIPTLPPRQAAAPSKKATNDGGLGDQPSSVDWAGRADDDISSALRACQRLLKRQSAVNDARKARLADRVRQRIAYQEYENLRDGLESAIENAWNKRQRAAVRKAQKDKKDKDKKEREKDKEKEATATLAQSIAALNQPQALTPTLVSALTKRRNLVDGFAHLFPEGGLLLPSESIYDDIEAPSLEAVYNRIEAI